MYDQIIKTADSLKQKLVETRRDFHKHAETGWYEMRTTSIILKRLEELGCYEVLKGRDVCLDESRMGLPPIEKLNEHYQWALEHGAEEKYLAPTKGGFTGAVAILKNGEGPTMALRFDIDALGVFEETSQDHVPTKSGFSSICPGSMHACGHDGHATIGLGVAEVLASIKDKIHGTVKLIFQPAEEGVRGAKSIVDHGHLDGVDYVLGSHVSPSKDGTYYMTPGSAPSLATTKLDVFYTGQSAHAAGAPEKGRNVMMAAANTVLNIYALPRNSKGENRINVGTLQAGSGRNVIPDRAKLEIEVRGQTTELNDFAYEHAMRVIEHSAAMYGCEYETKLMGAAPSMQTSPEFVDMIKQTVDEHLKIKTAPVPTGVGGSEDYAYMAARVIEQGGKASFVRINIPEAGFGHSPQFDFDEEALTMGVKIFCATVYKIMGK